MDILVPMGDPIIHYLWQTMATNVLVVYALRIGYQKIGVYKNYDIFPCR